jgi:hypothetical protein
MDDVLGRLATPFYAVVDFALDAPGAAVALAASAAVAVAILLLSA